jgi:thiamine biosynthesis protein ThiI
VNSLFVIRFGEIGTKGANRGVFERKLVDNVRYALERVGRFTVARETGRVTARSLEEVSVDRAFAELACVFGIAGVSVAREARLDFESICAACVDRMDHAIGETPSDGRSRLTFKIEARRANKAFPLPSLEIAKQVGAHLLDRFPSLGVDVHDPRIRIRVDVRERAAYVSDREMAGPGGIAEIGRASCRERVS